MCIEKTVIVSQATLKDTILGMHGLIEDAVTTVVITKSHNGVKSTDNPPQAML